MSHISSYFSKFTSRIIISSALKYYSIILLSSLIVPPSFATVLLYSNWENGNYSLDGWSTSGNDTAAIVSDKLNTPEPVCSGKAIKFSLHIDEDDNRFRTQLTLNKGPLSEIMIGKEYWLGFSIYLPDSYTPDSLAEETILDFHSRPDKDLGEGSRNATVSLRTKGDSWMFQYTHDAKLVTPLKVQGEPVPYTRKQIMLPKFKTGRWTNFVIHTLYSYKPEGYLDLWMDGLQVASVRNGIGFNDLVGSFIKIGIYKRMWDLEGKTWAKRTDVDSRLVYFDEVRIGDASSSFNEIKPSCINQPVGLTINEN